MKCNFCFFNLKTTLKLGKPNTYLCNDRECKMFPFWMKKTNKKKYGRQHIYLRKVEKIGKIVKSWINVIQELIETLHNFKEFNFLRIIIKVCCGLH